MAMGGEWEGGSMCKAFCGGRGDGEGEERERHAGELPGAGGRAHAGVQGRHPQGHKHRDGVVQLLERRQDARPPLPAHARAQGGARVQGLRHLGLHGHRPDHRSPGPQLHLLRLRQHPRWPRHDNGAFCLRAFYWQLDTNGEEWRNPHVSN